MLGPFDHAQKDFVFIRVRERALAEAIATNPFEVVLLWVIFAGRPPRDLSAEFAGEIPERTGLVDLPADVRGVCVAEGGAASKNAGLKDVTLMSLAIQVL